MKRPTDTSDRYDFYLTKSKSLSMIGDLSSGPIIYAIALWIAVIVWMCLDPSIVLPR